MSNLFIDPEKKSEKTRTLIECALMLGLSTVLSLVTVYALPQGGSITACSCVPLILLSYRHGYGYGTFAAFNHAIIQLVLGIENLTYCRSANAAIACVILDYLIAYTVLGMASKFSKKPVIGVLIVMFIRFFCHFVSGVYVWSEYWDSLAVWIYSFTYNGGYMLVEAIITAIVSKIILDRI